MMNYRILSRRVAEQLKKMSGYYKANYSFLSGMKKNSQTMRSKDDAIQVCRNHPMLSISSKEVPGNNSSYPEKEFCQKPKIEDF